MLYSIKSLFVQHVLKFYLFTSQEFLNGNEYIISVIT